MILPKFDLIMFERPKVFKKKSLFVHRNSPQSFKKRLLKLILCLKIYVKLKNDSRYCSDDDTCFTKISETSPKTCKIDNFSTPLKC